MIGKRVLVVDDEPAVADFLRMVVELEGGTAVLAGTGAFARECVLTQRPFDLMVLDLELPDLSGWDLLAALKDQLDACKVVIFSAQLTEESTVRASAAGVASIVVKPATAAALRDVFRSALELPPLGRRADTPRLPP